MREENNPGLESRVLAHEIGHTRGLRHDNTSNNLMKEENHGTRFTSREVDYLLKCKVNEIEDKNGL
jgi:predicted Zn-dependent protease